MLYELCAEVRNWFVSEKHNGTFTVKDGNMPLDFLQDGQYFPLLFAYEDGPATDWFVRHFHPQDGPGAKSAALQVGLA